jgi:hypothetical protein
MPAAGKTAMGSNDVTGIGIGSKIHHITHSHPSTAGDDNIRVVVIVTGESG